MQDSQGSSLQQSSRESLQHCVRLQLQAGLLPCPPRSRETRVPKATRLRRDRVRDRAEVELPHR